MAANYVLLQAITLTANVASFNITNLPSSGYTDLRIDYSARTTLSTPAYGNLQLQFNGDTGNNYSFKMVYGNSNSVLTAETTPYSGIQWAYASTDGATSNTFGSGSWYIANYLSSKTKTVTCDSVSELNATSIAIQSLNAGLWTGTSAISSITIAASGGTSSIKAGSTFYVYGIAAVGTTPVVAPYATGGDIVVNDGTYWYHAFLSTGSFTPSKALSCDALVIAGGGGGGGRGSYGGGGGGAGGLLAFTAQSLTATNYPITVGAGGPGAYGGTNGNDSQFASLTTAIGGGAGGYSSAGSSGGSGGGGVGTINTAGGSGTSGQGYAGAAGTSSRGGGGGGSGGAASTYNGGAGVNTYSSWATATSTGVSGYFAGGGGGGGITGTQGSGGAGSGSTTASVASPAVASTGSGGGGSAFASDGGGGNGGSGIVIIRYAMV